MWISIITEFLQYQLPIFLHIEDHEYNKIKGFECLVLDASTIIHCNKIDILSMNKIEYFLSDNYTKSFIGILSNKVKRKIYQQMYKHKFDSFIIESSGEKLIVVGKKCECGNNIIPLTLQEVNFIFNLGYDYELSPDAKLKDKESRFSVIHVTLKEAEENINELLI